MELKIFVFMFVCETFVLASAIRVMMMQKVGIYVAVVKHSQCFHIADEQTYNIVLDSYWGRGRGVSPSHDSSAR